MFQLMPLPLTLTVSCFSKIQIGFAFLVPAHLGSPKKGPLNGCVCVCVLESQYKGTFTSTAVVNEERMVGVTFLNSTVKDISSSNCCEHVPRLVVVTFIHTSSLCGLFIEHGIPFPTRLLQECLF